MKRFAARERRRCDDRGAVRGERRRPIPIAVGRSLEDREPARRQERDHLGELGPIGVGGLGFSRQNAVREALDADVAAGPRHLEEVEQGAQLGGVVELDGRVDVEALRLLAVGHEELNGPVLDLDLDPLDDVPLERRQPPSGEAGGDVGKDRLLAGERPTKVPLAVAAAVVAPQQADAMDELGPARVDSGITSHAMAAALGHDSFRTMAESYGRDDAVASVP